MHRSLPYALHPCLQPLACGLKLGGHLLLLCFTSSLHTFMSFSCMSHAGVQVLRELLLSPLSAAAAAAAAAAVASEGSPGGQSRQPRQQAALGADSVGLHQEDVNLRFRRLVVLGSGASTEVQVTILVAVTRQLSQRFELVLS